MAGAGTVLIGANGIRYAVTLREHDVLCAIDCYITLCFVGPLCHPFALCVVSEVVVATTTPWQASYPLASSSILQLPFSCLTFPTN